MADDKKVFDVTSPDKVKAEPTSKPVIIGHKVPVSDGSKPDKDKSEKESPDPLAGGSEEPAIKVSESKLSPGGEKTIEPSEDLVKEVAEAKKEPAEKPPAEKAEPEPEEKPDKKADEPDAGKDVPEKPKPEGNEAAVNTVLGDTSNTKEAEVEALEKQEKVKKLVDDGKYSLSIGQPRKHHGKIKFWQGLLIILAVVLATVAGFALAVDAELIKSDYKLPFDLIKKSQPEQNQSTTTTPTPPPTATTTENNTTTVCLKPVSQGGSLACSIPDLGIKFSYPIEWNVEGVVTVAKTALYETEIGSEEGMYKFDSAKKQWINKQTNKADYVPPTITTNKDFVVYDLGVDVDVSGSSVSGCHVGKLTFESEGSLIIIDVPTACAATIESPDGSTDIKYTIAQQTKDIDSFVKSIQKI